MERKARSDGEEQERDQRTLSNLPAVETMVWRIVCARSGFRTLRASNVAFKGSN